MSKSKDMLRIRHGLTQFVGSLLESSAYKGRAAKQIVCAALLEEALPLTKAEDGAIDLYVAKPLFRAVSALLDSRNKQLVELATKAEDEKEQYDILTTVRKAQGIISYLDQLIESAGELKDGDTNKD